MKKRTIIILVIILIFAALAVYKVTDKSTSYWGISVRFEDTSSEEDELLLLSQFVPQPDSTILNDGIPHCYSLLFMNKKMTRKQLLPIVNELNENELIRDASVIQITPFL